MWSAAEGGIATLPVFSRNEAASGSRLTEESRQGFRDPVRHASLSVMRTGIVVEVSAADRARLKAIVADRNSPQKHVWRSRAQTLR